MGRGVLGMLTAAVALAAGCASPGARGGPAGVPRPVHAPDAINVQLTPPAPVNWNDEPGPDGLQVRVFMFCVGPRGEVEAVPVAGTFVFTLYGGAVKTEGLAEAEPLQAWTYGPEQLPGHLGQSYVGWGYAFSLGWGKEMPQTDRITLLARYDPPQGPPLVATPLSIVMRPK